MTDENVFDKDKFNLLKDRENKWHQISMNQFSFYNNLLIALGVGYLAFVIKEFTSHNTYFTFSKIDWHATLIGLSISFIIGSTLFGLLCGYNRLVDFRYTHRTNYLRRKLYELNYKNYRHEKEYTKIRCLLYYWFKDDAFFNTNDDEFYKTPDIIKQKINNCSVLTSQLGKLTRKLLRVQIILFSLAIICFGIAFML